MKQLTFNGLCKHLKKKPSLSENVDVLSTLFDAAALLLGDTATGNVAGFIRTVAEKDKLIDLGRIVLQKILDQQPEDYMTRAIQMKEAYGLIYFTAFFDTLDHDLPDNIRKIINLSLKERKNIFQESVTRENANSEKNKSFKGEKPPCRHSGRNRSSIDVDIVFPDIVYSPAKVDEYLLEMYEKMAIAVREFIDGLSFRELAEEKDILIYNTVMENLPKNAVERFHVQYLYLCSQFNEFYIFVQAEQEKEKRSECDERYQAILSSAMNISDVIDTGFENMKEMMMNLPGQIKEQKVMDIADSLIGTYRARIQQPVIESKSEDEKLEYPFISEAFIPQRYKCLRYSGEERLELTDTWKDIEPQKDMTSFWAKYYLDPSSVDNILLILGEPGIGKSLLTKMLCARMSSRAGVFIRIPLREHNMEEDIESIVCKQITLDGDSSEPVAKFKWFAEEFPDNPVTLVFDGYDEVLQATGGVYRGLLKQIRRFQESCSEHKRPVRVIVTSRETLIDKADIPADSLVMKLLEFDEKQKVKWIDIWNAHNHDILAEEGIEDFRLPENNKDIEKLSGQPLLLLMLAIYDANFELKANSLTKQTGQDDAFNRTTLYNELIRRFVRRELRKGPKGGEIAFDEADSNEQEVMVNKEMKKLGIAALGMFEREKLSLTVDELDHDLEYMEVKNIPYNQLGRKMLKNAEMVFGSFFFIHQSRVENEEETKDATFEFLHKTFYEFLVADLVLFFLLDAVDSLYYHLNMQNRSKGEAHYRKDLENPDTFSKEYYAALNGVCLYTEPEVIQMIAEWKDSKIAACVQKEIEGYKRELPRIMEDIFAQHIGMICEHTFSPTESAWRSGGLADDKSDKSFAKSCAVYLMNLLILRILISGSCTVNADMWNFISQYFKLYAPSSKKDEAEQKDTVKRIPYLSIPSSEEMILKFMALFEVRKEDDNVVVLTRRKREGVYRQNELIDARAEVFNFMQDDITRMVYKLHDTETPAELKQEYRSSLMERGGDLNFEFQVQRLKTVIRKSGYQTADDIKLGRLILGCLQELAVQQQDENLVLDCLLCIREILNKMPDLRIRKRPKLSWDRLTNRVIRTYTEEIFYIFLDILKRLGDVEDLYYSGYLDYIIDKPEMYTPELVCAILETFYVSRYGNRKWTRRSFNNEKKKILPEDYFKVLKEVNAKPKQVAAFLKIFALNYSYPIADKILKQIEGKWDEYLSNEPEGLVELWRVFLQLGRFEEVKRFLNLKGSRGFQIFFYRSPELATEIINLAETVRADDKFFQEVFAYLNRVNIERYPQVFMQEIEYALSGKDVPTRIEELYHRFLKGYAEMLVSDTDKAVRLLVTIVQKESYSGRFFLRDIYDACCMGIARYPFVLEKSVKAAAHILSLALDFLTNKKYSRLQMNSAVVNNLDSLRDSFFAVYMTRCFDKALIIRDKENVNILIELLCRMDRDTKREMSEYFKEKYFYIKEYSGEIAAVIDQIYNGSKKVDNS